MVVHRTLQIWSFCSKGSESWSPAMVGHSSSGTCARKAGARGCPRSRTLPSIPRSPTAPATSTPTCSSWTSSCCSWKRTPPSARCQESCATLPGPRSCSAPACFRHCCACQSNSSVELNEDEKVSHNSYGQHLPIFNLASNLSLASLAMCPSASSWSSWFKMLLFW